MILLPYFMFSKQNYYLYNKNYLSSSWNEDVSDVSSPLFQAPHLDYPRWCSGHPHSGVHPWSGLHACYPPAHPQADLLVCPLAPLQDCHPICERPQCDCPLDLQVSDVWTTHRFCFLVQQLGPEKYICFSLGCIWSILNVTVGFFLTLVRDGLNTTLHHWFHGEGVSRCFVCHWSSVFFWDHPLSCCELNFIVVVCGWCLLFVL